MGLIENLQKGLTAAKGGAVWAKAIATGDVADETTIEERRAICRQCPTMTVEALPGMTSPSAWCGKPFVANLKDLDPSKRSCGCLLAGKTAVASQNCPQAKWEAIQRTPSGDEVARD
jgi:hypothetical protein